jgi:hypothetical protein
LETERKAADEYKAAAEKLKAELQAKVDSH